jgi:hypothetical protein
MRFSCICHGMAICINAFLNARKDEFLTPLSSLVSYLRKSEVYTAFCIHDKIPQVPEFIQVRWTSLVQTMQYLVKYGKRNTHLARPLALFFSTFLQL